VTGAAGVDPEPALADLRDHRHRVARLLDLTTGSVDTLKGASFALRLDADLALPLARWLHGYLGLLPVAVETPGDQPCAPLRTWLENVDCLDAWQRPWSQSGADLLLADGPSAMAAHMQGVAALELSWPVAPVPTFLPDPLLGARGAVRLVEMVARALFG